ncbi:MAG: hypothetical protein CME06_12720 [Gemmatimonadetes bacterium]|nr:hypothetical protein [Gemmatimonadota bacterium]
MSSRLTARQQPRETFVVGDVHGCADELEELLGRAELDPALHRCIQVGDLFTRGPNPAGVWELVRGYGIECLRGNHETFLLDLLPRLATGEAVGNERELKRFAAATAAEGELAHLIETLAALPLWIRSAPGDRSHPWVVVHAGVDPHTGFSPDAPVETLTQIRLWPPSGNLSTHWHDFYRGDELVIFGHDAIGGLVEWRDVSGKPRAIGLDTGCVYGCRLTGYWIERDTFISVPARATWWPVR